MEFLGRFGRPQAMLYVSTTIVPLLAVRFFAGVVLVGLNLPTEAQAVAGQALELYGIVLALLLFALFLLVLPASQLPRGRYLLLGLVGLHSLALALWLLGMATQGSRLLEAFALTAIAALASTSIFCALKGGPSGWQPEQWGWWTYLALLAIVPLAFGLRTLTALGLGTGAAEGGVLRGNWLVVNLPTLLLEGLAVATWANLAAEPGGAGTRSSWYPFAPLAFVPLAAVLFDLRPLSGFIFSATITWGSNLAVFVPAIFSLSLAAASLACYFSSVMLLRRKIPELTWKLFFVGSACIVLAGLYSSMPSLEGLTLGLLAVAGAFATAGRPLGEPGSRSVQG